MLRLVIIILFLSSTTLLAYSEDEYFASKLGQAISSGRKELEAWESKLGSRQKKVIEVRHNLAKILAAAGRFVEASHHSSKALYDAETNLPENDASLGEILTTVAKIELGLGRIQPAEAACQRALKVIKKTKKGQGQRAATLLLVMADVRRAQCRFAEAEKLASQGLAFRMGAKKHKELLLCEAKACKARALVGLGRFKDAEKLCQEVLSSAKSTIGNDHFYLAPILGTMCRIRLEVERYKDIYPIFKRQRDILQKALGTVSPPVLLAWAAMVEGAARLSAYRDGQRIVEEGQAALLKNCSSSSLEYCRLLLAKGLLELYLDEFQKAPETERALASSVVGLGKNHPLTARWRSLQEKLAMNRGEIRPQSVQTFKWVISVMVKAYGRKHPNYARAQYDLASIYFQQRKIKEAKELLLNAKKLIGETIGLSAPTIARIMSREAQILIDSREFTAAEKTIKQAILISQRTLGPNAFYTLSLRGMLSTIHRARGLQSDCANELEPIIGVSEKLLGPKHASVIRYKVSLAAAWIALGKTKKAKALLEATIPFAQQRFGIENPVVKEAESLRVSLNPRRRKR